jgi:hypothetical protein
MQSEQTVKMKKRITRPLPYVERRQISWPLVVSILALMICLLFLSYELGQLSALNRIDSQCSAGKSVVISRGSNDVYSFSCKP